MYLPVEARMSRLARKERLERIGEDEGVEDGVREAVRRAREVMTGCEVE